MATATAVVGLAGAAGKFFEGMSMQNKAQKAIDNFRWRELQNPYKTTKVSTLGSDLQKESASQVTASLLDTLKQSGTRGVMGGVGKLAAQNQQINQQIAANLDAQQKQLDLAAAQQEVRNQELINQRQSQELAGYGQMMNVGMGMKYGALGDLTNVAGFTSQQPMGQAVDSALGGMFNRPQQSSLSGMLQPAGMVQPMGIQQLETGL